MKLFGRLPERQGLIYDEIFPTTLPPLIGMHLGGPPSWTTYEVLMGEISLICVMSMKFKPFSWSNI